VTPRYDVAIIGAGSGGLTGAGFAASVGARVALIERDRIGGDCTWTGCVPSKALLKAAHIAHDVRRAASHGLDVAMATVNMRDIRDHVRQAVDSVYASESPEALRRQGIDVVEGAGSFEDASHLRVGSRMVEARAFIICTGARAAIPDLPGLDGVSYETSATFFDNDRLPRHLLVVGGGPIGVEMAQAYRRLGAAVTLVAPAVLPRDEPEAGALVGELLAGEGVRVMRGRARAVSRAEGDILLECDVETARGDMLLIATGRIPRTEGLGLEQAGVKYSTRGIAVDAYLRTSAHGIYAAGDVLDGPQFTHAASWQCFHAVRNALFPGNARGLTPSVPWVTFTSPEVAHVGLTEAEARVRHGNVTIARMEMREVDRAVTDGATHGFVKLVARRRGRLVGATIVAPRAGEMISEIGLALQARRTLGDLASTIHPYPTWSSALQQAASRASLEQFNESRFGRIVRRLARLRR
jgi:pyruvate/2-oxoglutarate dehydrogenase complex dihydrolipoamide dehydrogenase (E3) component